MISQKFIGKIKKEHQAREKQRRQIISQAGIVLHDSKRAIFSLHRRDLSAAKDFLKKNTKILKTLEKALGSTRLYQEGSYKAAVEEYVEAKMFYLLMRGEKMDEFKEVSIDHETYLGGMCDLSGELLRHAVNQAAQQKYQQVQEIKVLIQSIIALLVEFDMTGYLRTKYDQAKSALRKIEQIDYEINIRK